jgi:hypothetical protein
MPLIRTTIEDIALKIKPRNYSDILSLMLFLKRREQIDYVPSVSLSSFTVGSVGEAVVINGTTVIQANTLYKEFSSISSVSVSQGTIITVGGRATYGMSNGLITNRLQANKITAIIDFGTKDAKTIEVNAYDVQSSASTISTVGEFTIVIPTKDLVKGKHTICIEAYSANSKAGVRLNTATTDNIREFTLT